MPEVVCIGTNAGEANAYPGSHGVYIGTWAGRYATNSSGCVFVGPYAGKYNSTAGNTVLIGPSAGANAVDYDSGVAIGDSAGLSASDSDASVMIGALAGWNAFDAPGSVMIGASAGYYAAHATNSVFIGKWAGAQLFNRPNILVIDANPTYAPYGDNVLIYGEFDNRVLRLAGVTLSNGVVASSLNIAATNASGASLRTAGGIYLASNSLGGPVTVAGYAGLCASNEAGAIELYAIDSAGNATKISPHDEDKWVFESQNQLTGRRVMVDMEKVAAALGALEVTWSKPADTWEETHRRAWEQTVLQPWQAAKALHDSWQTWRVATDEKKAANETNTTAMIDIPDDWAEPPGPGAMPVFTPPPRPQWLVDRLKENPLLQK